MKLLVYLLIGLGVIVFLLIVVVLINTFKFKPKQEENKEFEEIKFDKERAIYTLQELLKCKTISYYDSKLEDASEFKKLENKIEKLFPNIKNNCEKIELDARCILYHLKGKNEGDPTVLMSHYDVVPVNEEMWEKDPFGGIIEDGVLWGRGAIDTKGTLNAVLNSVETMLGLGYVPNNDIYLAFGGNEEIAKDGAIKIVEYFKSLNIKPSLVIDEGGAVVDNIFPGVSKHCAVVGTAEKGMLNVELSVSGNGGHASTPPAHCAIGKLAKAVCKIEKNPYPFTLSDPAAKMFDTLGRNSSFLYRMIFSNLWLFKPILDNMCKKNGAELNALIRTTSAITQMEGSNAINVFPPVAKVCINFRLICDDTVENAKERLEKIVNDKDIKITILDGSMNPSNVSKTDGSYNIVKNAINATWNNTIVTPYLMLAGSDSRHYSDISEHIYRFSAMHLSKEERAMIHGNNERIPLETICKAVEFYINVLRQL